MLKLYTDAAVKASTGRAGIGFVVSGNALYEQIAIPLEGNDWNNHLAEFEAIKQALNWIIEKGWNDQTVFLYSDSKTAVDAVHKEFAKQPLFQTYTEIILALLDQFPVCVTEWIPEKNNKGADNLARQALRKAEKGQL